MEKKQIPKVFKVYYFEGLKKSYGTLVISDPDKLGDHKTALLTVEEPVQHLGKTILVSKTNRFTRNWEVFIPRQGNGLEYEVIVLKFSKTDNKYLIR